MKEDYLWDRTGEPDEEIQDLEDVLGTLRYQPRPLVLPIATQPVSKRRFFPAFAIAATIVLTILAATIWLRFHRQQTSGPGEIATTGKDQSYRETPSQAPAATGVNNKSAVTSGDNERRDTISGRNAAPHRSRPPRKPDTSNSLMRPDEMRAAQREEGEAAKEQLMLALRVASTKLNLAQRKAQGAPLTNYIRNQHKLG